MVYWNSLFYLFMRLRIYLDYNRLSSCFDYFLTKRNAFFMLFLKLYFLLSFSWSYVDHFCYVYWGICILIYNIVLVIYLFFSLILLNICSQIRNTLILYLFCLLKLQSITFIAEHNSFIIKIYESCFLSYYLLSSSFCFLFLFLLFLM